MNRKSFFRCAVALAAAPVAIAKAIDGPKLKWFIPQQNPYARKLLDDLHRIMPDGLSAYLTGKYMTDVSEWIDKADQRSFTYPIKFFPLKTKSLG